MSLLAYGQGLLAGDIGAGAGLAEPWTQVLGLGYGDHLMGDVEHSTGEEASESLSHCFSLIQACSPSNLLPAPPDSSDSVRRDLHWDSPPQSPSAVFVHLPYSFLQIVATGTQADAVVVGVMGKDRASTVETLLCVPRMLGFGEKLHFRQDLEATITGKLVATAGLQLPGEFTTVLSGRPQLILGRQFDLERYTGIIFGLWLDGSQVTATAEAIFADAVKSLPMLLSNRINARKYENLGRRFDAILKVMPEAVVFVDDEMGQVVINPAAAELLGLPSHGEVDPSKVAGAMRKLAERCSSRTDPQQDLLSSEDELEIEEYWELKMPRRVLHVRSYPVSSHSAHGRLWLYEDVTAEKDAEEAIEAANRAKSQFLAMMSHELRTPMTGVLGMLDLLQLTSLVAEQQGLVRIMQESAEGLMDVINNILDYCKMEAGRLVLEEIDFSLSDIFEQIQTLHKHKLTEKGLKMTVVGQSGARIGVRGDPIRFRQILLNLVSNAIKFTEKGSITVSWRYVHPRVQTMPSTTAMSGTPPGVKTLSGKTHSRNTQASNSLPQDLRASTKSPPTWLPIASAAPLHSWEPSSPCPPSITASLGCHTVETRKSFSSVSCLVKLAKRVASEQTEEEMSMFKPHVQKKQKLGPENISSCSDVTDTASQICKATCGNTKMHLKESLVREPSSVLEEQELRLARNQDLCKGASFELLKTVPNGLHMQASTPILSGFPGQTTSAVNKESRLGVYIQEEETVSVKSSVDVSEKCRLVENKLGKASPSGGEYLSSSTVSQREIGDNFASVATGGSATLEPSRAAGGVQLCKKCGGVVYVENNLQVESKAEEVESKTEQELWLEIKVSDTGEGITKEQLERLFAASQAGSQRRDAAGTGLGLAICKGLLSLMRGFISLESEVGRGTSATMTVPMLAAESSAKLKLVAEPTPPERPTMKVTTRLSGPDPKQIGSGVDTCKRIRVLVAEDNKVNQLLIRKMFHHYGHEVELVGNGKLAVEAVQKKVFDLVLMDVQMPILDGLSATKAIRALTPPVSQIPIYALSADAYSAESGPMEETGLDGYLNKPIAWEKMSGVVEKILASKYFQV